MGSFLDAIMDDLPEDMKSMKNLQSFTLWGYSGLILVNCKFEYIEMVEFKDCSDIRELFSLESLPNLKVLKWNQCDNLRELWTRSRGYQRLKNLVMKWLYKLESLGGSPQMGVWDERTLSHLRILNIHNCDRLDRFG